MKGWVWLLSESGAPQRSDSTKAGLGQILWQQGWACGQSQGTPFTGDPRLIPSFPPLGQPRTAYNRYSGAHDLPNVDFL